MIALGLKALELPTKLSGGYDEWPITVIKPLDRAFVRKASYLKAADGMSLADAFIAATAVCTGATLVTADRAELEAVAKRESIPVLWIRPQPAPKKN